MRKAAGRMLVGAGVAVVYVGAFVEAVGRALSPQVQRPPFHGNDPPGMVHFKLTKSRGLQSSGAKSYDRVETCDGPELEFGP